MDNISVVIMDIDGSLVNSHGIIGEQSIRELFRLKKEGCTIILASGRHIENMVGIGREIGIDKEDYYIADDGQYIYDGMGNLLFTSDFLTEKDTDYICSFILSTPFFVFTEEFDYCVCCNICCRLLLDIYFFLKKNRKVKVVSSLSSIYGKVKKIRFIDKTLQDSKALYELSNQYSVHSTFGKWLEVSSLSSNKYEALIGLSQKNFINIKESLFFGNDYNDVECFSLLPHTVAMGNSPDEIKKMASYITLSDNEDGIGKMLSKIENHCLKQ